MTPFSQNDRQVLRDLARRVREIAADPVMAQRKTLWSRHNALGKTRPLVLIFPEGSWIELMPETALQCDSADARRVERNLRQRIYTYEHFQDDTVCVAEWVENAVIHDTGWGLWGHWERTENGRGAGHIIPCLNTREDFKKMHLPELSYDERATRANVAAMQELLGDLLEVKFKGKPHLSYHLANFYMQLRGLEQLMVDMYDEPEFLHEIMRLFVEGHTKSLRQLREFNLLALNNDNTYHSSGGIGWTDELPAPGFNPDCVRTIDMWSSAEAQELALVSPEQHYEFVMQYEAKLLEPFGLNGYGCCEDLSAKIPYVLKTIPRIRRISISPFADVAISAANLRDKAIYSWKPHPSHLVGRFDPELVRSYLQNTITVCKENGCILELILKDTHTCENRPERFEQWSAIAHSLVEAAGA